MRRFRRFRFSVARWVRMVVLLGACASLLLLLVDRILLGPMMVMAEAEARTRGVDAVNRVVFGSLTQVMRQGELVTYIKDEQGQIAAYQINTPLVTQVAAEAARSVQVEFRRLSANDFLIPLGAFSGSRLLGARGPRIAVRMVPVGSVSTDVQQEFTAEGINQTRHSIWINAVARVRVVMPLVSQEVTVTSRVPVSETVIVGQVPQLYGGALGGVTVPVQP